MKTLTLSVQSETGSQESAADALQSEMAAPEPLFSGPAPALWAGFGAVVLVFLIGMMLIIRGRVVRAKPKPQKGDTRTYFEPAGDDAEITFDDQAPAAQTTAEAQAEPEPDTWRDNKIGETEVTISHGHHDNGSLLEDDGEQAIEEAPAAPEKKKKSAFAGLFSKKSDPEPTAPVEEEDSHAEEADTGFFSPEEPSDAGHESAQSEPSYETPPPSGHRPRDDHQADRFHETNRLEVAEEAARQALQRAEEAEALAQDLKRANDEAQNVMSLGLRRHEAAMDERAEALMLMEKRLADLSDEFQTRLHDVTLAAEKPAHAVDTPGHHDPHANLSEAHFAEFADLMGEQFDALRGSVNAAIEKLSRRLDKFPASPAPVTATAARIQLSDLLRDVLAPKRYKLAHKLSNGRTADATILMPAPMAPIAIDARFPVEAFDAWQLSRNAGTEMELRRSILRNIADAGEKLIALNETADCAMMFVPSEQILSELHAHFSDVVQESYRARVWMVAPTSLMATLHTISAVMARAGIKDTTAANMMDELETLRARVSALEAERRTSASSPARAAAPAQTPAYAPPHARTGPSQNPAQYNDLFASSDAAPEQPAAPAPASADEDTPFPLR